MADSSTLDVFGVTSSAGLRMSQYQLSLDPQTNALGFSFNAVLAGMADMVFWIYRFICAFIVWVVNLSASFGWLDFVRGGLNTIAGPLQQLIEQVGFIPFMMALTAVVSGVTLIRGKTGAGLTEMATSAVMAALVGGLLARPVTLITGPDGMIIRARDLGTEASTSITGEAPGAAAGAKLVDVFVDLPAQLVNFGKPLSSQCAQLWHQSLSRGPYPGDAPEVRAAVEACAAAATSVDGVSALGTALVLSPSTIALLVFTLVIAVGLLMCGVIAAKDALKLLWVAPRAIAPGDGRTEFLRTASSALFAAVGIALLLVMLTIQMELLQLVFVKATTPTAEGGGGYNPMLAFLFVDVLVLVVGVMMLIYLINNRKKSRQAAERLRRGVNPGAGAGGTSKPSVISTLQRGQATVTQWKTTRALSSEGRGRTAGGPAGSSSSGRTGETISPDGSPAALASTGGAARGSRVAALARNTGKVAVAAGMIAFGATLGAPVSVPRWTRSALNAATTQKKALQQKFATSRAAVSDRISTQAEAVGAYGREYAHNVGAVGAFAGRVTGGVTGLHREPREAREARENLVPPQEPTSNPTSTSPGSGSLSDPVPLATSERQHGVSEPAGVGVAAAHRASPDAPSAPIADPSMASGSVRERQSRRKQAREAQATFSHQTPPPDPFQSGRASRPSAPTSSAPHSPSSATPPSSTSSAPTQTTAAAAHTAPDRASAPAAQPAPSTSSSIQEPHPRVDRLRERMRQPRPEIAPSRLP